jgi:hypothetical protein
MEPDARLGGMDGRPNAYSDYKTPTDIVRQT